MDIYKQKSRWKIYLSLVGIITLTISLIYTNFLSQKLAEGEKVNVQKWLLAQERINDPELGSGDLTIELEILRSNTSIPMILVNEYGEIEEGVNFGDAKNTDIPFLKSELKKLKDSGVKPIHGFGGQKLYYKESKLLQQLRYFPLIQLILIGVFMMFGYLALSTARRSEQNRVWVGMAKETAHQLGTPISAIIAWLEHLKSIRNQDEEVSEVVSELEKDVDRLNLVADRFSKIGSEPTLESKNLYEELSNSFNYMRRRAPRKVVFQEPVLEASDLPPVQINSHLFSWVTENLMRNALDAMEGQGTVSASVYKEAHFICIDLTDTGKGIPHNKHKTIFQPGYTTKKRGWGLGLSLAKRIIEDYHKGKIFVKRSEPGKGTTFTIKLPVT